MSSIIKSIDSSFLYKLLTFGKTTSLKFDNAFVYMQQNDTKRSVRFEDVKIMAIDNK